MVIRKWLEAQVSTSNQKPISCFYGTDVPDTKMTEVGSTNLPWRIATVLMLLICGIVARKWLVDLERKSITRHKRVILPQQILADANCLLEGGCRTMMQCRLLSLDMSDDRGAAR